MAETLAARGWDVLVASAVDRVVIYGGVRYAPVAAAAGARCDLLALINTWGDSASTVVAGRRLFLYHDTRPGGNPDTARCVAWADRTLVDSPFSRGQLASGLPSGLLDRVSVFSLPIRVDDYSGLSDDRPDRLLYSSMPDRGLVHLARWFPRIRARVPSAELHVTGDFTMYGRESVAEGYQRAFAQIAGVHYHGHVTRSELVALQKSSKVLAYPCTFPEGFCIAAAEAMAAGAVPVTSDAFALRTTVGSAGVLIPGHPGGGRRHLPHRWLYGRRFVREVARLLSDAGHWRERSGTCRKAAEGYSTDAWYQSLFGPSAPLADALSTAQHDVSCG